MGPFFYHQSHPQQDIVFALAPSLHSFCSYFSTDFQYPITLPFHTVHGVLKARILKWFAIPSPVDHILSALSTMTRQSWVAPWAWFMELDKAVVLV